ncbi:MAG: Lrp/AsnC family transcriptional regulator [Pseudomonadota bacterium]
MASVSLDSFDLAILRHLQQDATLPQRQIAEQVNLSAPSVQRRIRRMTQTGVIERQAAHIDPARVGLPLTILVEVELNVETGGKVDTLKQTFTDAPEVQQCYYVTGEADFVLVILVADMAEYEALTHRLFFASENIKRFKTFVAMDRTKAGMELNI